MSCLFVFTIIIKSLIFNISGLFSFYCPWHVERFGNLSVHYRQLQLSYIQVVLYLCGMVATAMISAVVYHKIR